MGPKADLNNSGDKRNEELTIAFVGDICLGLSMPGVIGQRGGDFLFEDVGPYLKQADLRVGNLECCLVDSSNVNHEAKERMAVPSDTATVLKKGRFDILNLANNHILDCGPGSLALTKRYLENMGIRCFGAGSNLRGALDISYINLKGKVIAFLGFSDTTRYYSNDSKAGIAPMSKSLMAASISEARKNSDLVVVSLHADLEFSYYPSIWRVNLSRWLVEQGASIIIQHHPHVIQGVELYGNGFIAYSLGNFIFNWHGFEYLSNRKGVAESVILKLTVKFEKKNPEFSYQVIPINIDTSGKPQISNEENAGAILGRFLKISEDLKDKNKIRKEWLKRSYGEFKNEIRMLYWMLRSAEFKKMRDRVIAVIKYSELRRWVVGLLTLGYR